MTDAPPGAIFIEEAGPSDLPALVALEQRCATHPWTERHFASEMDPANDARTIVARDVSGLLPSVVGYCAFRLVVDELHIHNLGVAPEHRRRHVARTLIRTGLAWAVRRQARSAHLEVREGNLAARCLYESEGFRVTDRRRSYYADPVEDALLMDRAL